jgi:hypothetical protein
MVTTAGQVKLWTSASPGGRAGTITRRGMILGTDYMSPEHHGQTSHPAATSSAGAVF